MAAAKKRFSQNEQKRFLPECGEALGFSAPSGEVTPVPPGMRRDSSSQNVGVDARILNAEGNERQAESLGA